MRQNATMNWKSAALAALLLFPLVGCQRDSAVGVGGKKRDKAYATVVSLSPSTTDYLVTAGGGIYLGGRTASCDQPQLQKVPIVVSGTMAPDYEMILSLEPDLVIYDKTLYSDDEIAKIKELGVDTIEYDVRTVDDYADFGYRLASKLALETFTSEHIDRVYQELETARARSTTKPRTTVLLGPSEGGYLVMGVEGIHGNLIRECGGTPVGAAGRLFQIAKIESLIEWDPEVIYSDMRADEVYADPRLQALSAVKDQRVYNVEERIFIRVGGRLDGIIQNLSRDLSEMPVNPREGAGS
jgi:iron complex transport system substrate-binding protein